MKNLVLTFCLLFLFFGFSSCNHHKYTIDGEILPIDSAIVINIDLSSDTIYFSHHIKEIEIVPLESKEDAIIGSINSIKYADNMFFILDYRGRQIYTFDRFGKFRGLLSHNGRGPGEYLRPMSICIDKSNKQVVIVDNNKHLRYYDYDGHYLSTKDFDFTAHDFEMTPNSYCFYTSKSVNFKPGYEDYYGAELSLVKQKKLSSISRYIPVNKNLYPIDEGHLTIEEKVPFSSLSDSYTFHYNFTDYIYSIDKKTDEVSIKYVVDFGKNAYKDNLWDMGAMEALDYISEHPKKAGFVHTVVETDSLLMFKYSTNKTEQAYMFNKNSKESVTGPYVNDVFRGVYDLRGAIDDMTFFYIVEDPSSFIINDRCSVPIKGKEVLKGMTKSDNPLIAIVSFK